MDNWKNISELVAQFRKKLIGQGHRPADKTEILTRARRHLDLSFKPDDQLDANTLAVINEYRMAPHRFLDARYYRQIERADYRGAPDQLKTFCYYFYQATRKRGFPVYAHTVWRSPQLQRQLKREGKSNLSSGAHQRSAAVDFVHLHHHWEMHRHCWEYLGEIGKNVARTHGIDIEWGGDWEDPYDPAHWELAQWEDLPEIPEDHSTLKLTLNQLHRHAT